MKSLKDFVSDVLKVNKVPVKVIQPPVGRKEKIRIDRSAILFFDTYKNSQDFHDRATIVNKYAHQFNFYSYVEDAEKADSNIVAKKFQAGLVYYEHFLLHHTTNDNEEVLTLITYSTFHQPKCRSIRKIEMNQFYKKSRKWKTRDFHREKFLNFNSCEMIIKVLHPQFPEFFVELDENGEMKLQGYGPLFNDVISKRLNYTYVYQLYSVHKNGSINQSVRPTYFPAQGKLFNHVNGYDFEIHGTSFRRIFAKGLNQNVITFPHTTVDELFIISRSAPFSQFEKIFLPFESEVWHWLIASMAVAVFVIFIFQRTPKFVQKFVFGMSNQSPLLNLM